MAAELPGIAAKETLYKFRRLTFCELGIRRFQTRCAQILKDLGDCDPEYPNKVLTIRNITSIEHAENLVNKMTMGDYNCIDIRLEQELDPFIAQLIMYNLQEMPIISFEMTGNFIPNRTAMKMAMKLPSVLYVDNLTSQNVMVMMLERIHNMFELPEARQMTTLIGRNLNVFDVKCALRRLFHVKQYCDNKDEFMEVTLDGREDFIKIRCCFPYCLVIFHSSFFGQ